MSTAYLNTIDFALAKNKLTNEQLAKFYPEFSEEQILKNTGIHARFAVDKNTVCTDFAAEKVLELLKKHQVDKNSFDFLIYCTEAPDYIAPASSVILQQKLGLKTTIGTFDLNFGCSGYTHGLLLAKSLIESGIANKVLFVTADIPTQVISSADPTLRFLFSDAVSMNIISAEQKGFEISRFIQGTDGSGEKALHVENSGFNQPRNSDWFLDSETKDLPVGRMTMDGMAVFRFSLDCVPKAIEEVLVKNKLKQNDIDLFVFHQASSIILKSLQRKLNIADSKIFNNIDKVGNTVSASIPIALCHAIDEGLIKKDMNILIIGFGIGFSWSATILKTKNV